MRAVVWAGVSSRAQTEDKDSLARQLEEGESLCNRHGWQIVAQLQVPGATRDYIDLPEAIEGLDADLRRLGVEMPNAYRELGDLISHRALDVLVCRGRDRLGRTDSLVANIEERLRRADAKLYSLTVPPTGSRTGDLYVAAFERASSQHEMERLKERWAKGMDNRLRLGLPPAGGIPFPYFSVLEIHGNKTIRTAITDAGRAASYLWAVNATLGRTHTAVEMGDVMRVQWPEFGWSSPKVRDMLRNPMPVGLLIRRRAVMEGEDSRVIVYAQLDTPHWQEIVRLLGERLQRDNFASERKLQRHRIWLVTVGRHQAIIEPGLWLELQRFLDLRSEGRRPPSRTRVWSSLLWCARCGAQMYATSSTRKHGETVYGAYVCSEKFLNKSCDNPQVAETRITEQMFGYLLELAEHVPETNEEEQERNELGEVERQLASFLSRRRRVGLLFETERIDIDEYDKRIRDLNDQQSRLEERKQSLLTQGERSRKITEGIEGLTRESLQALFDGDAAIANRWLRGILYRVWVDGTAVVNVEL
jgi:DNA invertase Pin-like site-specific DNA recombinase